MTQVYDKSNDRQNEPIADNTAITIGVFIDGTLNNSHNVTARKAYEDEYKKDKNKKETDYSPQAQAYKKYTEDDASYENDHTNVYKLYEAYPKTNGVDKVYIEGIGTVYHEKKKQEIDRYDEDDPGTKGPGYGKGINGIRGKVYKACEQAVSLCPKNVQYITFDVFGFSRGAAAARNLIYELTRSDGLKHSMDTTSVYNDGIDRLTVDLNQSPSPYVYQRASETVPKGGLFGYLLRKKSIKIEKIRIKIRFIGVFDTVASYDPVSLVFPSFDKYCQHLKMNEMVKHAKRIVHLTSEYEHRENFALTPVSNSNNVREHCLPGVHSDVGGGYIDGAPEKKEVALQYRGTEKLEVRKKWLANESFFLETDLSIEKNNITNHILKSNRKKVNARYNRIPLRIMTDYGNIHAGGVMFKSSKTIENTSLKESKLERLQIYKNQIVQSLQSLIQYWRREYSQTSNTDARKMESDLVSEINRLISVYSKGPSDFEISDDEILFYTRKVILSSIFEPEDERGIKREGMIRKTGKEIIKNKLTNIAGVEQNLKYYANETLKQIVLLRLRRQCLHWSAHYAGLVEAHSPVKPMDNRPTENGIRLIHHP